jgi:hypothetical protein
MAKYRVYGVNGDATYCACCGRTDLNRVVWMAQVNELDEDIENPSPYGTVCAAKLLGWANHIRHSEALRAKLDEETRRTIERAINETRRKAEMVIYEGRFVCPDLTSYSAAKAQELTKDRYPILHWPTLFTTQQALAWITRGIITAAPVTAVTYSCGCTEQVSYGYKYTIAYHDHACARCHVSNWTERREHA